MRAEIEFSVFMLLAKRHMGRVQESVSEEAGARCSSGAGLDRLSDRELERIPLEPCESLLCLHTGAQYQHFSSHGISLSDGRT